MDAFYINRDLSHRGYPMRIENSEIENLRQENRHLRSRLNNIIHEDYYLDRERNDVIERLHEKLSRRSYSPDVAEEFALMHIIKRLDFLEQRLNIKRAEEINNKENRIEDDIDSIIKSLRKIVD